VVGGVSLLPHPPQAASSLPKDCLGRPVNEQVLRNGRMGRLPRRSHGTSSERRERQEQWMDPLGLLFPSSQALFGLNWNFHWAWKSKSGAS